MSFSREEMTPDSSKSTMDRTKESVTNTADKAAAGVQPDGNKSTTQEAFDKGRREHDASTGHGGNLIDKVCITRLS